MVLKKNFAVYECYMGQRYHLTYAFDTILIFAKSTSGLGWICQHLVVLPRFQDVYLFIL